MATSVKLGRIIELVHGQVLTPPANLELDVRGAFGADLMSDVLAAVKPGAVLLTGLCSQQAIRTAQVTDIVAVIFVGGKEPFAEVLAAARDGSIPLFGTPYCMYEACGRLYQAGVPVSCGKLAR